MKWAEWYFIFRSLAFVFKLQILCLLDCPWYLSTVPCSSLSAQEIKFPTDSTSNRECHMNKTDPATFTRHGTFKPLTPTHPQPPLDFQTTQSKRRRVALHISPRFSWTTGETLDYRLPTTGRCEFWDQRAGMVHISNVAVTTTLLLLLCRCYYYVAATIMSLLLLCSCYYYVAATVHITVCFDLRISASLIHSSPAFQVIYHIPVLPDHSTAK